MDEGGVVRPAIGRSSRRAPVHKCDTGNTMSMRVVTAMVTPPLADLALFAEPATCDGRARVAGQQQLLRIPSAFCLIARRLEAFRR